MTIEEWLGAENKLGIDIWHSKYQHNGETLDEWFDRVSGGNKDARRLIEEKKFLFGGRILANRGVKDKRTVYSNCYVITAPEDSIESIYKTCSRLARTYSLGGGCGIDISKLAPRGAKVNNAADTTSGAVSFMDTFSQVTGQIGQHGRRGALMISLDCHHPDLEEFIDIKTEKDRVQFANISVRITDDFMRAVRNNDDWTMSFTRPETGETVTRTAKARYLFHKFCENNWNWAEPGMLYWDTINRYAISTYIDGFEYAGTNPCFTGDMKLLTEDGYKTFNELNGKNVRVVNYLGHVTEGKVWHSGTKQTVNVITEDGVVTCTPNHVFMLADGTECAASDIAGKNIRKNDGTSALALSVTYGDVCDVYDFSEPETHWGVVEGFVVHNCGEEPLPADGSCLLGSINLAAFVNDYGLFDYCSFQDAVRICVRGLNEVLDEGMPLHPLKGQRRVARDWRQIGLGIMGLSDMLIKMQIRYGSQAAINAVDTIGDMMATVAIEESVNLAEQYGAFPKFDKSVLKSPFIYEHTSPETRGRIAKYGMRNSQLLTIPPTGSIASLIGCGYGVEPVFANYYTRTTKSIHKDENGNAVDVVYKMYSGLAKQYADEHGLTETDDLPDYFIDAQHLDYHERLDMQAAWQKHIDASISSTVNVPQDFTVEQVESMYMEAWEKGLKGVTMFRAGCMRAPILDAGDTNKDAAKEEQAAPVNGVAFNSISPVSRKTLGTTHGDTYSCKCACGTLYITVNRDDDGNVVETFVHTSKGGVCQANIAAVSRMVSLALRSGVKIDEIVDQLRGINCPACANRKSHGEDLSGLSCPDIISRVLKDFAGHREDAVEEHRETPAPEPVPVAEEDATKLDVCPVCGKPLTHTGGCAACMECGWQKCNG